MSGLYVMWIVFIRLLITAHPYYVSVTEIEYQAGSREIGIACKIFTDDFELALRDAYRTRMDLYDTTRKPSARYINDYIARHVRIKADGVPVSLTYLGYQIEGEATWSFFEAKGIASCRKLEIYNDLLYESKKEQINMMHARVNGSRKSARLTAPETSTVFEF